MAALGHISLKIIHRYPSPLTFAASTKSMTIISIPNALESLKTTGEKIAPAVIIKTGIDEPTAATTTKPNIIVGIANKILKN